MNKVYLAVAVGILAVSSATMSSADNCRFFSNAPGSMIFDPDKVTNYGTGRWTTTSPAIVKLKASNANNIYFRQSLKDENNGDAPIGTPTYGEIWLNFPADPNDADVYDARYDYGNSQNGYQGPQKSSVEMYEWTGGNNSWGIGSQLTTPTVNYQDSKNVHIGPVHNVHSTVGIILRIRGVADMVGTAWKNTMTDGQYRATHEIVCIQ